jgi:hypothetical protein
MLLASGDLDLWVEVTMHVVLGASLGFGPTLFIVGLCVRDFSWGTGRELRGVGTPVVPVLPILIPASIVFTAIVIATMKSSSIFLLPLGKSAIVILIVTLCDDGSEPSLVLIPLHPQLYPIGDGRAGCSLCRLLCPCVLALLFAETLI